jgi:uncharacterized protein (TIGR03067 family)
MCRSLRLRMFLVLAAGCLIAAEAPGPKAAEDRLHGTWYIVSLNRPSHKGGRELLEFHDTHFTLTFDRGTVTSIGEGKTLWQGVYRLDAGGAPGVIHISRRFGAFKQGIYESDGDSLKLCLDYPANPRPTSFSVAQDSRAEMMVFKRLKPGS